MKETLKKYSPKRENVNLGWLNKHLADPELWKWNKRTIAKAFAIGLFCAFLPIPGRPISSRRKLLQNWTLCFMGDPFLWNV